MKSFFKRTCLIAFCLSASLYFASCSRFIPATISGRIKDFHLLKQSSLRFTFENYDGVDSLVIKEDGSFFLTQKFTNTIPETFTLWQDNQAIAKFILKDERDSILIKNPLSTYQARFAYDNEPIIITDLEIQPTFDSTELAILNIDKIFTEVENTGDSLLFHFSSVPPKGSSITVWWWGHKAEERYKDTTFAVSDTLVAFPRNYFKSASAKANIMEGGHFNNPYGWSKRFGTWEFEIKRRYTEEVIREPKRAVFPLTSYTYFNRDDITRFTPILSEVDSADILLEKYFTEEVPKILKRNHAKVDSIFFNNYFRQYYGIIENERKIIFVNGFCRQNEDFYKYVISHLGGGSCYFNAEVILQDKKIKGFEFNGPK